MLYRWHSLDEYRCVHLSPTDYSFWFTSTEHHSLTRIQLYRRTKTSERIADTFAYGERTAFILERQFGPQTVVERLQTKRGSAMPPRNRVSVVYVIYIIIFVLQMQRGKFNYSFSCINMPFSNRLHLNGLHDRPFL